MKEYKNPAELKSQARVHMFGRYGVTVRAYIWMNVILLILSWLFASMNNSGAGSLISLIIFYAIRFIISGVFTSSLAYMYLNIGSDMPAYASMIFYAFKNQTDKAVLVCMVIDGLQLITCLPLIVAYMLYKNTPQTAFIVMMAAGVLIAIIGILYITVLFLPAYYLIHDFPDRGFTEILSLCPKIMKGHMSKAAMLYLSFIPLFLVEIISLGAAAPWVDSYLNASVCELYLDIMRRS